MGERGRKRIRTKQPTILTTAQENKPHQIDVEEKKNNSESRDDR